MRPQVMPLVTQVGILLLWGLASKAVYGELPSGQVPGEAESGEPLTMDGTPSALESSARTNMGEDLDSAGEGMFLDAILARERAIDYMRDLAAQDEAQGWLFPPHRTRKVVGGKPIMVRFTEKEVDVPVYEMVEEFRNVKVGESYDAVTVRKKVKVQIQVGTRKEMRVVRDPHGEIVKEINEPIWGPGGPDYWKSPQFGLNAMGIYALMRAGVDPQDEAVRRIADRLFGIYQEYGIPDSTWDLAWSTAAFSMIRDEAFQDMARKMAGKLLAGQITEGPAAGLWGPVCVDRQLLAAMMARQIEYSDIHRDAKNLYELRMRDSAGEKMEQALQALRGFEKLMRDVAMLAPRIDSWGHSVRITNEMSGEDFVLPIYPDYIYNQASADMDSTAIAMYGLRVAAEQGLLPAETWSPQTAPGRPLVPPRKTVELLRGTVSTLAKAQQREGWSELNLHQPVTYFDGIRWVEGVPADAGSFKPLPSPFTGTSTVQGYSVYSSYGHMAGLRGLTPFGRHVVAANASVKTLLHAGLENLTGGSVPPYEACFYLGNPVDLGKPETRLGEWEAISDFLLSRQNDDGSWGGSGWVLKKPSSLRVRMETLPVVRGPRTASAHAKGPHVYMSPSEEATHMTIKHYLCPRQLVSTAYALLALSMEPSKTADESSLVTEP